MPRPPHRVAAITATYRRPEKIRALVDSLAAGNTPPAAMIVVDNGGDFSREALPASLPFPVRILSPGRNLGCGGGVAHGLAEALADPAVTHAWILDDDSEAVGDPLPPLLGALEATGAAAATPLICGEDGTLCSFPGPLTQPAWALVRRRGTTPAVFRERCGEAPLGWRWAPWMSLVVTREAVSAVGLPRSDFWFQQEDIEWTLRITDRFAGILVPGALSLHLPPINRADPRLRLERRRLTGLSMLQNGMYMLTRLPHCRAMLRHTPGNAYRFLASQGFGPRAWLDAARAHWMGGMRGRPAGTEGFNRWQSQYERTMRPGA